MAALTKTPSGTWKATIRRVGYETMAERAFISLPRATPDDLRARANRPTDM